MSKKTLYERLGGYDAISAVADDLLPRLQTDSQLARFWQHRGEDGLQREKQFLIDFLSSRCRRPTLLRSSWINLSAALCPDSGDGLLDSPFGFRLKRREL